MGSNVTTSSVNLAVRLIDVVNQVCDIFERSTGHKPDSGLHSSPSFERYYKLVLSVIQEKELSFCQQKQTVTRDI